jgi:3-oxoacyl-[acyl-carrier protein] reductase
MSSSANSATTGPPLRLSRPISVTWRRPTDLVDAVVSEFGGLDLLVSNAGVEHFGALETITQADFDHLFRTNVAGQLFVPQAAVAAMTDGGRIVLSSSVSVRLAVRHHTLYAASKAALPAMVRTLAPELAGRNIAINAISPGATNTGTTIEADGGWS